MIRIKFQVAKFLNTIGFKNYAKSLWVSAEKELKQAIWGVSSFQNTFVIDQGLLTKKLEPKQEIIESLADEQIFHRAAQFLNVFGFTTLRSFIDGEQVKKIDAILNDMQSSLSDNKTLFTSSIETNRDIQEILLSDALFNVVSKIIGPFWYFGSDAAVKTKAFPLHRDTFFNPPLYKIFIPTQPGVFQVLCGSHIVQDKFSKNAGSYICDWDKPNDLSHGNSSIYFHNIGSVS